MNQKLIKSKINSSDVLENAKHIEKIYSDEDVKINSQSFLGLILKDVKENYSDENSPLLIFNVLHVSRIAEALEYLNSVPNKKKYLYDLLKGSLDFMKNTPSHAKSILWELEVFTKIKKNISTVSLNEPDIVVDFEKVNIGIPCKKISSEKGLQSVLSKAVSQIEKNAFEFGIVAIDIDNILPENMVMQAKSSKEALDGLFNNNIEFINRHEHHFLKYLNSSRIIAVLISSSVIVAIKDESPRFNNAFQWAVWTVPNLKVEHKEMINKFKQVIL